MLIVCIIHKCQGGNPPGRPGKVREFDIGRGKVMEIRKGRGNCGLPEVCYQDCDSYEINVT